MRVATLAPLLVLLAPAAMAQEATVATTAPSCLEAAAMAETEWKLPPGMLAAIGRVESGRLNPLTRRVEPWPWAINSTGTDRYHINLQDALADVTREQAAGVRSLDVGCFQINLMYHPTAFANLGEAFDPLANARYAARFLTTLRSDAGSWDLAIARYHSAVFDIGEPYRQRVMANWQGGVIPATLATAAPFVTAARFATAAAPLPIATSGRERIATSTDRYVIQVRAAMFARITGRNMIADPHVIHVRG